MPLKDPRPQKAVRSFARYFRGLLPETIPDLGCGVSLDPPADMVKAHSSWVEVSQSHLEPLACVTKGKGLGAGDFSLFPASHPWVSFTQPTVWTEAQGVGQADQGLGHSVCLHSRQSGKGRGEGCRVRCCPHSAP